MNVEFINNSNSKDHWTQKYQKSIVKVIRASIWDPNYVVYDDRIIRIIYR